MFNYNNRYYSSSIFQQFFLFLLNPCHEAPEKLIKNNNFFNDIKAAFYNNELISVSEIIINFILYLLLLLLNTVNLFYFDGSNITDFVEL